MTAERVDPVLAKRARIAGQVKIGKRVGYGLYAYAIAAFVVAAITRFTEPLVTSIVVALAIGSILLIPAIVFGYGVKAAEREERHAAALAARQADAGRSGRQS